MDFTKYLKNKDLQITNDDVDIEKLTKDLRKGYTADSDIDSRIEDAKKAWDPKTTKDYTDIESKYNTAIKDLGTANETIKTKNLQMEMMSRGFKKESFDEVSKLRYSLYADEQDDSKAIENIATRFKDTYFKTEEQSLQQKNYDNGYMAGDGASKKQEVKITRNTSLSDLKISK